MGYPLALPGGILFYIVIAILGWRRRPPRLYHTMLDVGLNPSASICKALIMALCNCNAGMLKDARQLLDDMLHRGTKCSHCCFHNIYLDACFKAGDSTR